MSRKRTGLLLTLLSLSIKEMAGAACDGIWTGSLNNHWGVAANWSGGTCYPSFPPDTALFNAPSPQTTVSLSDGSDNAINVNLSSLTFNTLTSYTISPAPGGGTLGLSGPLNVLAGSHEIDVVTELFTDSVFTINGTLKVTGSVFSELNQTLTMQGEGTLITQVGGSGFAPQTFILSSGQVMNNGSFSSDFGSNSYTVSINGGLFMNTSGGFFANNALLTVNGGLVINISGEIFPNTFLMNGGIVENTSGATLDPLTFAMKGGTIHNSDGALFLQNPFTASIAGGLVTLDGTSQMGPLNLTMTGGTLVNDGMVLLNISQQVFDILERGLVQGTGSFNGPGYSIVYNGATFMPGDPTPSGFSPGTLNFLNQLTYFQSKAGSLVINILDSSSYGSIVTGSAHLDGTLKLVGLPGFDLNLGDSITILTANDLFQINPIVGTFSNVVNELPSGLYPLVDYMTDSVVVTFFPDLYNYAGSSYLTIFSTVNEINLLLDRQMERMREHGRSCYCRPVDDFWNLYAGPIGSFGQVHSKGRQVGFNYWTAGAILGADYTHSSGGIGLLIDYERISGHPFRRAGDFNIDQLHGTLYGTLFLDPFLSLNALFGGGYDWIGMKRAFNYIDTPLRNKGSTGGGLFDALVGVQYDISGIDFPNAGKYFYLSPFASAQYILLGVNAYREQGAGLFDLEIDRHQFQSFRSSLGLKLNWELNWGSYFNLHPELNVAWQREFLDVNKKVQFRPIHFSTAPSSTLQIVKPGHDTLLIGAHLLFNVFDRYGLEVNYEFEGNTLFWDHFFYLGVNADF